MTKIAMFQQSYAAVQSVFSEGDAADRRYAVPDGRIEMTIRGREIDVAVTGNAFGEMALIAEAPRSAKATALADSKLVPITAKRFNFLVQQTLRFTLQIVRIMSNRLRHRAP